MLARVSFVRVLFAAVVAAACLGYGIANTNVVTMSVTEDFTSIIPTQLPSQTDRLIAMNVYGRLVRLVPGTSIIEPDLATSWSVSEDGLVYTFWLREGVTWHHGYGAFTADDVVFSVDLHKDPVSASREAGVYAGIESAEAIDDHTVVLRLARPSPALLTELAWQPGFAISRAAFEDLGALGLSQLAVGTGPYVMVSHVPGEEVVLTAFGDYYGPQPAIETLRIVVIPDEALAIQALLRGQVDAVPIGTLGGWRTALAVLGDEVSITDGATNWNSGVWITNCKEPFSDIRVRQALVHAIDFDDLYERFDGYIVPNTSFIAFQLFGHVEVDRLEYDPDRARALLEEAGVSGFDVRFLTQPRFFDDLTVTIADYWRRIGLNVMVQREDRATYTQRWIAGDYDAFINGLGRVDPLGLMPFFSSRFPANPTCYSGGDDLWAAQATELNQQRRAEILAELQQVVSRDVQFIPIGPNRNPLATRQGLSGLLTDNYLGVVEFREAFWETGR